jgi:transposase
VESGTELERLRAALAARDADLAARDAKLAALHAELVAERARRAELEEQVAKLAEAVRQLREVLGRDSGNSNRPPSSDPPGTGAKAPKGKRRKGRRRGGQKGHRGTHRELLAPEHVDTFEDLYPPECENCWAALPKTPDPFARRYQYTELKPLAAHTTEYRRHAVACPCCGHRTRAAYDEAVIPSYAFGPRLMAVVAMLTGVYHLSRRQTVRLLWELLGVRVSLGSVSAIEKRVSGSVEPAVDEAWEAARSSAVKHADGTSWLRAGVMLSLWVVATAAVTVFKVLDNGQNDTLRVELFGRVRGILVSDRATALKFWAMARRQICWAHLVRKFVSFAERDGPAGKIGQELLEYTGLLFEYWSLFRRGRLSRATLLARMAPVRRQVEALLERAVGAKVRGLSGSCEDILEHRAALWTFLEREGVEPTNNHAERELRAFVLWRRRSFGSQSKRGDLFATRMMTIAHTARKQGRDVLTFLAACCAPRPNGAPAPSLFAPA